MESVSIPLHGKYGKGKHTIVDGDYDGEYFSLYRWRVNKDGYVVRMPSIHEGRGRKTIYLHREVQKCREGYVVDHINRDKLDNRSINLREATRSLNAANKAPGVGVYKIVSARKGKEKWVSKRWSARYRGRHLGTFDTEDEASSAYLEARKAYIQA